MSPSPDYWAVLLTKVGGVSSSAPCPCCCAAAHRLPDHTIGRIKDHRYGERSWHCWYVAPHRGPSYRLSAGPQLHAHSSLLQSCYGRASSYRHRLPAFDRPSDPGATHEIAPVAQSAQQPRAWVWRRPLPSATVRTSSCLTSHNAQPLISHASPLGRRAS